MPLSTRLLVFFVWTLCVAAAAGSRGDELTRAARPESPTRLPPRRLAPGVETTIPARVPVEETFSRHNIPELLKIDPNWDWAKDVRFQHRVWTIEFTFKPVRFIDVDVPQRDGRMRRERVWYMIYHVRNPNRQPVPFYPSFSLEDQETKQRYPARLIPVAIAAIERRERPPKRLLDTPSISRTLPAYEEGKDNSLWGVATWTDVDPRIDYFSVIVKGLTNAYRWQDLADGSRRRLRRMLKLNFWRPGDQYDEHEREIRLGVPGQVDYEWVFR